MSRADCAEGELVAGGRSAGDESVGIPLADRAAAALVQVDDQAIPTNGLLPTK
jgi:hypothetical protein